MQKREEALLNTRYFHVVFTLPDSLNELALSQPREVYDALFKAAWLTLKGFAENPKFLGAKTGMSAVLHTWGQTMSLHPHLHCIVPAGGITTKGQWKRSKSKGKYLFDVKAMSVVFRAKYVQILSGKVKLSKELRDQLFAKNWVVYAKQPFYGPKQVIEYLGRYTHKIAISNHRIKGLDNNEVCFAYKDYRHANQQKIMRLKNTEFIRRFALHILPKGYTRIRHYGILASATWKQNKNLVDRQLGAIRRVNNPPDTKHRVCTSCKTGSLVTVYCFDQRGPPEEWLLRMKHQNNKKK
jgi:hypothetical protein